MLRRYVSNWCIHKSQISTILLFFTGRGDAFTLLHVFRQVHFLWGFHTDDDYRQACLVSIYYPIAASSSSPLSDGYIAQAPRMCSDRYPFQKMVTLPAVLWMSSLPATESGTHNTRNVSERLEASDNNSVLSWPRGIFHVNKARLTMFPLKE